MSPLYDRRGFHERVWWIGEVRRAFLHAGIALLPSESVGHSGQGPWTQRLAGAHSSGGVPPPRGRNGLDMGCQRATQSQFLSVFRGFCANIVWTRKQFMQCSVS